MSFRLQCMRVFALFIVLTLQACGTNRYYAGVGSYTGGIQQGATQADGGTGAWMPLSYPITLRHRSGTSGFHLHSAIDTTILYPRSGPEGEVKNTHHIIRSLVGYRLTPSPRISIAFGPVLSGHKISGDGTIVALPNGNSTANFATPGYSRTSWIVGLDAMIGIEYFGCLLSAEVIAQGFAASAKRNFAGLLALSYRFGDE
jgi:hypothetical protein